MSIKLKVPEVGESVTEVAIGEWLKQEGDHVDKDEPLVALESDKATFDAPAEASGTLVEIVKQAGEMADIGEVIARLDPDGDDSSPSGESESDGRSERKSSREIEPSEESPDDASDQTKQTEASQQTTDDDDKQSSHDDAPMEAEAEVAEEESDKDESVDSEDEETAGEHGRDFEVDPSDAYQSSFAPDDRPESDQESKSDPDAESKAKSDTDHNEEDAESTPAESTQSDSAESKATKGDRSEDAAEGERVVPMSAIRRRIASRLVEAQQNSALLTTFNEIDMSAVKELRSRHQAAFQETHNVKLGFMSFLVKAVAASLKNVPELNAEVRDNKEIVYHDGIHIGIAIGSDRGLVVPVLRDADRMSFGEIEQSIEDFARRAGRGELGPDEMQGGTFTISNGGIYGSLLSTPIVNPPQSGVLGMHTIQDRPVVRDDEIVIRPMMYVALTYDHRIIDGREAVTFLKSIREMIESPERMLLDL